MPNQHIVSQAGAKHSGLGLFGSNATTTTTVDAYAVLEVPVGDVTPQAQYKGMLTFTLV